MYRILQNIDGSKSIYTENGMRINLPSTENMIKPVICSHCGKMYDLSDVKVIHRYADCTLFTTPCCKTKADDREWKSFPDFTTYDKMLNKYF